MNFKSLYNKINNVDKNNVIFQLFYTSEVGLLYHKGFSFKLTRVDKDKFELLAIRYDDLEHQLPIEKIKYVCTIKPVDTVEVRVDWFHCVKDKHDSFYDSQLLYIPMYLNFDDLRKKSYHVFNHTTTIQLMIDMLNYLCRRNK